MLGFSTLLSSEEAEQLCPVNLRQPRLPSHQIIFSRQSDAFFSWVKPPVSRESSR